MKRILVIDDEPSIQILLKKMIERGGFDVLTASDGKQGMALVHTHPVDLVVTDLIMPEKEGIEVIMELRKTRPDIPVIAISGGGLNSSGSYLRIAREAGAHAVLEKPVSRTVLLHTIENLLTM
jgi:CheY-like chemotaxis protein